MYTLEDLKQKNLKELKEIGWQLNVLPEGDRRCRRNWINALAGVNPPLLELLEVSPGVEPTPEPIEPVAENFLDAEPTPEPIEIQALDAIESKFDRITYPKPAAKIEPEMSQSSIALAAENSPGVDRLPTEPSIKLSDRLLNLYAPPSFSAPHSVDSDGQLKLLERVTDPEPPDPDHYATLPQFWAVMNAWNATFTDSVEQFKDLDIPQENNAEFIGTDTEREGAREIPAIAPAIAGGDICSKHDGASIHSHDEGLGSQKGDRILEESGANSGDSGGVVPHQPTELTVSDTILDFLRDIGHKVDLENTEEISTPGEDAAHTDFLNPTWHIDWLSKNFPIPPKVAHSSNKDSLVGKIQESLEKLLETADQLVKTLDIKSLNKTKRESRLIKEKEIKNVRRSIKNLEIFQYLQIGMLVSHRKDAQKIGIVANLTVSTGGMPEVSVKWDADSIETPEAIHLLDFLQTDEGES